MSSMEIAIGDHVCFVAPTGKVITARVTSRIDVPSCEVEGMDDIEPVQFSGFFGEALDDGRTVWGFDIAVTEINGVKVY